MAVPTYDLMMRPVLELASRQDITRRIAEQAMRNHFHKNANPETRLTVPVGRRNADFYDQAHPETTAARVAGYRRQ